MVTRQRLRRIARPMATPHSSKYDAGRRPSSAGGSGRAPPSVRSRGRSAASLRATRLRPCAAEGRRARRGAARASAARSRAPRQLASGGARGATHPYATARSAPTISRRRTFESATRGWRYATAQPSQSSAALLPEIVVGAEMDRRVELVTLDGWSRPGGPRRGETPARGTYRRGVRDLGGKMCALFVRFGAGDVVRASASTSQRRRVLLGILVALGTVAELGAGASLEPRPIASRPALALGRPAHVCWHRCRAQWPNERTVVPRLDRLLRLRSPHRLHLRETAFSSPRSAQC